MNYAAAAYGHAHWQSSAPPWELAIDWPGVKDISEVLNLISLRKIRQAIEEDGRASQDVRFDHVS
jgi:hypothetical protein